MYLLINNIFYLKPKKIKKIFKSQSVLWKLKPTELPLGVNFNSFLEQRRKFEIVNVWK